jgi:3-oxo-5alpha-steroid 4-dehydrogenase
MDEDGTVLGLELLQLTPGSDAVKKHARAYNLYKRFRLTMPPLANYLLKVIDDIEANAQAARPRLVRITRGVVLAAGGFIFNREMAEHYVPKYTMGMPLGTPGCDGSGIRLGESVGAATELMEKGSAWRFINPPQSFVEGIVVNPDGERFVNELSYGAKIGEHLAEKYQGKGTLIVNRALVKKALPQLMPGRAWLLFQTLLIFLSLLLCTKRAKTIEQLAEKCGLQSDRLRATIERYNEAIATGTEDPLGKGDEYRHSLAEGPYYAIDISIGNPVFPCATLTFGGLQVDEGTGQVRREDGSVFKNLYAAGRTAVGFSSRSYVSGLSLSDCIFSGRRAGQHMAESE